MSKVGGIMRGLFITFEGGEGTGKTTQSRLLKDYFTAQGREVILTREPGGTPEGEKIRNLLVQRDGGDWTAMAECLLFFAARHMHVEKVIAPALAAGKIVICDRFTDSTIAYQGYGHGFDRKKLEQISKITLDSFSPDLTFLLDLDPFLGLKRSLGQNQESTGLQQTEDRFEQLELEFHEKLRKGFIDIAKANPKRVRIIPAEEPASQVHSKILEIIEAFHVV